MKQVWVKLRHLLAAPLRRPRARVADGGDRDARAEVDEGVAVDVDEHTAAGGFDEDREHVAHAFGDAALPAGEQRTRRGPGMSVTSLRSCASPSSFSRAVTIAS